MPTRQLSPGVTRNCVTYITGGAEPIANKTNPAVSYENVAQIYSGSAALLSLYVQSKPRVSTADPIPVGYQRFVFVYNEVKSPFLDDGVTPNPDFDFAKLVVISPIIERPGAVFDWEPPIEEVQIVNCNSEVWWQNYGHPFDNGIVAVMSKRGDQLSVDASCLAHFTARFRMAP